MRRDMHVPFDSWNKTSSNTVEAPNLTERQNISKNVGCRNGRRGWNRVSKQNNLLEIPLQHAATTVWVYSQKATCGLPARRGSPTSQIRIQALLPSFARILAQSGCPFLGRWSNNVCTDYTAVREKKGFGSVAFFLKQWDCFKCIYQDEINALMFLGTVLKNSDKWVG